jgi:hypothetical protein
VVTGGRRRLLKMSPGRLAIGNEPYYISLVEKRAVDRYK